LEAFTEGVFVEGGQSDEVLLPVSRRRESRCLDVTHDPLTTSDFDELAGVGD
jgi:hypothetical protein